MEEKKPGGFRLVTNPESSERDIKVFLSENESNPEMEALCAEEAGKPGSVMYATADFKSLVLLLNETEELKGIPDVRFCAAGRGYVKFTRTGGGAFPPEENVRKIMSSLPSLPKQPQPVTIRQNAEHPEGVVVRNPAPSDVDRFIAAYMRLGGTFPGLVDAMEEMSKWTSSTR